MDERTARALNAINRRFYRANAAAFDETRAEPWPGWERVVARLEPDGGARVLDIGCGNGRFAAFVAERLGERAARVSYAGVDSCAALLARARERALPFAHTEWLEEDVLEAEPSALGAGAPFALIALFGFLHHVPGRAQRVGLLRALARRLRPGGLLALATWQFAAFERFRSRIVPWEAYNRAASEPIDPAGLEPGDHLLPWKRDERFHRYCHFADEREASEWLAAAGLRVIERYRADGRGDALNLYFICDFSDAQPAPKRGEQTAR